MSITQTTRLVREGELVAEAHVNLLEIEGIQRAPVDPDAERRALRPSRGEGVARARIRGVLRRFMMRLSRSLAHEEHRDTSAAGELSGAKVEIDSSGLFGPGIVEKRVPT